jgi:hypothetical protein
MLTWIPSSRLFGGDGWSVGFYRRPLPVFEKWKKTVLLTGEVNYSWWRLLLRIERKENIWPS